MKYFEVVPFALCLTPGVVAGAARTLADGNADGNADAAARSAPNGRRTAPPGS